MSELYDFDRGEVRRELKRLWDKKDAEVRRLQSALKESEADFKDAEDRADKIVEERNDFIRKLESAESKLSEAERLEARANEGKSSWKKEANKWFHRAEAAVEDAANYEMAWFSEKQRAEAAESKLSAVEDREKRMREALEKIVQKAGRQDGPGNGSLNRVSITDNPLTLTREAGDFSTRLNTVRSIAKDALSTPSEPGAGKPWECKTHKLIGGTSPACPLCPPAQAKGEEKPGKGRLYHRAYGSIGSEAWKPCACKHGFDHVAATEESIVPPAPKGPCPGYSCVAGGGFMIYHGTDCPEYPAPEEKCPHGGKLNTVSGMCLGDCGSGKKGEA